jgi:cytoskeleton protein RodZ
MSPSINTTPSDDPNMLEPNDTPGRRLRALRESRKLDVERVAAQLHLQRHVVEAIEGDQYERLPAPVFVVGYLKNYARLLGADPAPIVTAYRAMVPARDVGLSHALSVPDDSSHSSGGGGRWGWAIAVLLIGVVAGVATLWLRGQSDSALQSDALALSPKGEESASTVAAPAKPSDTSSATTAANTVTPAPASPAVPESTIAAPPESIPLRGAQSPSPAGATPAEPAAPTTPEPEETLVAASTLTSAQSTPEEALEDGDEASDAETQAESVTEEAAAEPTSTEVVLEFTGTSWVDVRGANGRVVLNGEMRSGDRRVLDGEPPYKFVIGNSAATQLTVGGRPFDLKGRAQGNVARFSLDPSSIE